MAIDFAIAVGTSGGTYKSLEDKIASYGISFGYSLDNMTIILVYDTAVIKQKTSMTLKELDSKVAKLKVDYKAGNTTHQTYKKFLRIASRIINLLNAQSPVQPDVTPRRISRRPQV